MLVIKQIESFKNNKLGYRICFHFRRNPFFQNKMIVKELHLGMGGELTTIISSLFSWIIKNCIIIFVLIFLLRVSGVLLKPNFVAQRTESGWERRTASNITGSLPELLPLVQWSQQPRKGWHSTGTGNENTRRKEYYNPAKRDETKSLNTQRVRMMF